MAKQSNEEKAILEEKVEARTAEVVEKSKEIELKNKDIIDSITYAKRIQDAILFSIIDVLQPKILITFILKIASFTW